jgi:hypothetical protein
MLETALECAARGWAVLPLVPRGKNPLSGLVPHGFKDATKEEEAVRRWWAAKPDANIGIACGASGLTVLDIDRGFQTYADALAWVTRNSIPVTYAVHTGRRLSKDGTQEYGVQLYFAGTMGDVGNFHLDGCSGQVKSLGGLVMAEGNIHPATGLVYERAWGDPNALAPLPDSVRALKSESERKRGEPFKKIREGDGRHDALMREACSMRARGLDADMIYAGMVGLNQAMCEVPISDEDLRAMCDGIVRRYPAGERDPQVTIGGKPEFEDVESVVRPIYPDSVWDGTPYGEFADYCVDGNFIPKRFFSEALRTVVGSVAGNQLSTDYQGVNARAYTVLIGPPGSGKGTAITAARQFVECEFDSQTRSSERPLLWSDMHNSDNWCWPSRHIGAHVVSPASAPGLIQATKPHKLEKGESRDTRELWRDLPRFITIQEEIGGLFANFANENSGRGLETAILELYDRDSFTTTATNERSAKSGRLLYSILGGIPKKEWEDIFARASSVGSGLFSRLNIIGTENECTVAGLPEYNFAEMQRRFLPRITALERTPARIPLSPNGRALLNEWFTRSAAELKDKEVPSARLNIHALRVALHLAWLHGHANILESDVDAGIKVADFQAKMREFYLPAEGESREAQWEQRIMKVMRTKRSLTYRELQKTANAARAGTTVWERALAGLRRDGRIAVVEETTKAGKTRKSVKLLKQND